MTILGDSVTKGSNPLERFRVTFGTVTEPLQKVYHTKTWTVAIGPVSPPKTSHFNLTNLAQIKYLSSDRIVI